ncbi:ribosome modulation factor [Methylobacterium oxalidis]|uniref:Uncharacterized protein n=1 Tax=Methylobacterium oxalidis TaxID=944322 RepID=A0A512JAV5_9HYPH|nr:hypothetical protein [Methylobacterium oxalidis]GEP07025.1 hypothetical protein MOX02_50630 [Methylobacterium oxalidis]GLS64623.1 hypothetical protein GCM10007888_30040 [Methylobacterium oxalidis]
MSVPVRSPAAVSVEGRHAFDRGDPIEANPYPEGSEEHATWKRGWQVPDGERGDTSVSDTSEQQREHPIGDGPE